jgi:hypothetical protein
VRGAPRELAVALCRGNKLMYRVRMHHLPRTIKQTNIIGN